MDKSGEKVAAVEPLADGELVRLVAEYYEAVQSDIHKDCDCHWQVVARWSYGEFVGWFVEHDGYSYDGFEGDYGEDGPYPTREAAVSCMAGHLRAAIAAARARR